MKKEFNIGDRVKAIKVVDGNEKVKGQVGTIIKKRGDVYCVEFDKSINGHAGGLWDANGRDNHCWYCTNLSLELVGAINPDKLIFNGNATILIKDGKKYVSKCADGDTYDKEKGLLLCLAKANGVSYEDLRKMIDGAEAENTVKEVKRPAKVGEYIKIVAPYMSFGDYGEGDILKVASAYGGSVEVEDYGKDKHGNGKCTIIFNREYVVLENYKPYKITLSEFWESKDKLAIHYDGEEEGERIFDLMIKKGFCCENDDDEFWVMGCILNDKKLTTVKVNETTENSASKQGYKIYEADEVDLNN